MQKERPRKAVIIGATSGIGKEIACILIEKGWQVGIAGRRLENLEKLSQAYPHSKVVYEAIDVTASDAGSRLENLIHRLGGMVLYLHVSGFGKQNPELDPSLEMQTVQTNATGFVAMVSTAYRYFETEILKGRFSSQKPAHLAIVSSVAGTRGLGVAACYSSTKKMQQTYLSALVQLSRRKHLPICFSDIQPGFVNTDFINKDKNYPMMIEVGHAAQLIVNGLEKKRRFITVDWKFRIVKSVWKLIPRWIWERMKVG